MIRLLPFAITRVDELHGCVAALTSAGRWVRPEPISLADLIGAEPRFSYERWSEVELESSRSNDARPEDRWLASPARRGPRATASDRQNLIDNALDPSITAAFTDARSVGIVKATVHRVYIKRSTGGRDFVRVDFTDDIGDHYDWIVPDIRFDAWVRQQGPEVSTDRLRALDIRLTIGLTKPQPRFPGMFGGCHPLVVGLHTVPDYAEVTA